MSKSDNSGRRVAVAASSRISADAGALIAREGGNAVDAAIGAAIVSLCTDIGIVNPAAGAFVTVWPPHDEPVVIDGCVSMPGLHGNRPREDAAWEVVFDYKGETRQRVGFGAVAVPGAFASFGAASERYGRLPWSRLLKPAIAATDRGSPLTAASAEYLSYTHRAIYDWHPDSFSVLHHDDGRPLSEGDSVFVPHLADSLRQIAREGAGTLYGGSLGQRLAAAVQEAGGLLNEQDLAAYEAVVRQPITAELDHWSIATNPAPSVGGPCLVAMLHLLRQWPEPDCDAAAIEWLARVQRAVLGYRREQLDGLVDGLPEAVERMLDLALQGPPEKLLEAPSTIHVSAVDREGWSCAVTSSGGYGSGAIAPGTGMWLNNSLGEVDLLTRGLEAFTPGARLTSNMAPTVARRPDGGVMAIGTPGASRITTALAQVLWQHFHFGLGLNTAVAFPRLHVELATESPSISAEPGLPMDGVPGFSIQNFPAPSMYFGGVQAARWSPETGLSAVGDSRRAGCVAYA